MDLNPFEAKYKQLNLLGKGNYGTFSLSYRKSIQSETQ